VTRQIRSELLKLRTTRTMLGLVLGLVAVVVFIVMIQLVAERLEEAGIPRLDDPETQRTIFATGSVASLFAVLVGVLIRPLSIEAQTEPQDPERGRKTGTYLNTGLAHWQGNIFSEGALTQWDLDLFDTGYNLTSINVEVESYFGDTFLQLSGFSIGYRKDVIRRADSGHMFSAAVFRDVDLKLFAVKAGGGMEWGMPSLNFDRTEFAVAADGTVRYRHTHPDRNADVPLIGTTTDGALYPFVELSVVQRPWIFLTEAGVRINVMGFNFDDYEVSVTDQVTHSFRREKVLVPYLYVNMGIRLF